VALGITFRANRADNPESPPPEQTRCPPRNHGATRKRIPEVSEPQAPANTQVPNRPKSTGKKPTSVREKVAQNARDAKIFLRRQARRMQILARQDERVEKHRLKSIRYSVQTYRGASMIPSTSGTIIGCRR